MTTRKKTASPAELEPLKAMVREQTLQIKELTQKIEGLEKSKQSAEDSVKQARSERDEAKAIIENAHDLIDACPAALPRTKKVKPYSWSTETTDVPIDLLVRMGSWLGATK